MKTLVLGLGNPIISDDGVGIYIAREVARQIEGRFSQEEVHITESSMAGLTLLDLLNGYNKAIIIDAIQTNRRKAGEIYRLEPKDFDNTRHASSPHDTNFATALELGRRLNLPLPTDIVIFAIEVEDVSTFSEECTPIVHKSIPACVDMVIEELGKSVKTVCSH